jgi:hypothetical protein
VHIFFPSDECLKTLTRHYSCSVEKLIDDKKSCKQTLDELSTAVNDLRFLEYDQLLHCGSYWDWKTKGGYIHISPLTWGANPKICPAMNYCETCSTETLFVPFALSQVTVASRRLENKRSQPRVQSIYGWIGILAGYCNRFWLRRRGIYRFICICMHLEVMFFVLFFIFNIGDSKVILSILMLGLFVALLVLAL